MSGWPPGTGRLIVETCDSTTAEAMRQMSAGVPLPFWLLTRRQTEGRGRRGRAWHMREGDFAATHVQRVRARPEGAALRSFTTVLALREAIDELTGLGPRISLKWPNDLLFDGAKLAGILLGCEGQGPEVVLSTGIGVNLAARPAPELLDTPAVEPALLPTPVAPDALLDALAPAVARWERVLEDAGFEPVRAAWLAHAARLGEMVTARLPTSEISGRFRTLDARGALVLDTAEGARAIAAAEVQF
ncbi:MAG: biotin--[acetyl-CoA-carboxylase] ligase [Pseudomonadota bacterium]